MNNLKEVVEGQRYIVPFCNPEEATTNYVTWEHKMNMGSVRAVCWEKKKSQVKNMDEGLGDFLEPLE